MAEQRARGKLAIGQSCSRKLARFIHGLHAPWLGLRFRMPFSILTNARGIGSGLKSPAPSSRDPVNKAG